MKRFIILILFFLPLFARGADTVTVSGSNTTFRWSVTGAAQQKDSLRFINGNGITWTQTGYAATAKADTSILGTRARADSILGIVNLKKDKSDTTTGIGYVRNHQLDDTSLVQRTLAGTKKDKSDSTAGTGYFTQYDGTLKQNTLTTGTLTASAPALVSGARTVIGGAANITVDTSTAGTGLATKYQDALKATTATTLTVAGTANQIISSAGAQDLSVNRTWTLSTPQNIDTLADLKLQSLSIKSTLNNPSLSITSTTFNRAYGTLAARSDTSAITDSLTKTGKPVFTMRDSTGTWKFGYDSLGNSTLGTATSGSLGSGFTPVVDARIASAATWNAKEPAIASGTTSQYWRGDKSWQTLDKTAVGLDQVDNISLLSFGGNYIMQSLAGSITLGDGTGGDPQVIMPAFGGDPVFDIAFIGLASGYADYITAHGPDAMGFMPFALPFFTPGGSWTLATIDGGQTFTSAIWHGTSIDTAYTNAVSNVVAGTGNTVSTNGKTKAVNVITGGENGFAQIQDTVLRATQSATIGATSLTGTSTNGLYRVTMYLYTTTGAGAATVTGTIAWNDGAAQSTTSSTIALSTLGSFQTISQICRVTNSAAITYATTLVGTVLTAKYEVDVVAERLF